MQVFVPMLYMCAVLLVPIVPAYLLYRTLPSELKVDGPFRGLNVRLTGAFAGYFLLVLVASGFAYSALSTPKPVTEVWTIAGKVQPSVLANAADGEEVDIAGTTIAMRPPNFLIGSEGEFSISVIVRPGLVEGRREFPMLEFSKPGYQAVFMPLNSLRDIEVNDKDRIVTVKNVVTLGKLRDQQASIQWRRQMQ